MAPGIIREAASGGVAVLAGSDHRLSASALRAVVPTTACRHLLAGGRDEQLISAYSTSVINRAHKSDHATTVSMAPGIIESMRFHMVSFSCRRALVSFAPQLQSMLALMKRLSPRGGTVSGISSLAPLLRANVPDGVRAK